MEYPGYKEIVIRQIESYLSYKYPGLKIKIDIDNNEIILQGEDKNKLHQAKNDIKEIFGEAI